MTQAQHGGEGRRNSAWRRQRDAKLVAQCELP